MLTLHSLFCSVFVSSTSYECGEILVTCTITVMSKNITYYLRFKSIETYVLPF